MPTIHLPFGGSTIDRIIKCPAAYLLSKEQPKSPGSPAAQLGTLKHTVMEQLVKRELYEPAALFDLNQPIEEEGLRLAEEHLPDLEAAQQSIAWLVKEYDLTTVLVEPFVTMIPDKAGGSIDYFGVSEDGKTAVIADYKFGYNPVAPTSPQLLFYALCADYDETTAPYMEHVENIVTAVIQPSNETRGEDVLQTHTYPFSALDDFDTGVVQAIKAAEQPDAPAMAGSHCYFCPAQTICPIKTGQALQALKMSPKQSEDLAEAMSLATQLEPWIKAVKTQAHQQLELGSKVSGWKLVAKRRVKKWLDLPALRKFIANSRKISVKDVYTETPITPTQALKMLKEKEIDTGQLMNYIDDSSSGTTMAPEGDKRPAAVPSAALKMLNG